MQKIHTQTIDYIRSTTLFMGIFAIVTSILLTVMYLSSLYIPLTHLLPYAMQASISHATEAADVTSPFHYHFRVNGKLQETGSMQESSSPYFWLNSGGTLILTDGVGETFQGSTSLFNNWHILYNISNALDTGGGDYPQNLLRLITRSMWNNVAESLRFNIRAINLTGTPNRDGYSGVLLMSRYYDGDNLYYAGIRMDGTAVIKKKYQGTYYTLAQIPVFPGNYDRTINPNLIPTKTWMRIRSITYDRGDSVVVELWLDKNDDGVYEKVLTATDTLGTNGNDVIHGPAYLGIRTDYMDVIFDDYHLEEL